MPFDGVTYERELDSSRLSGLLRRVEAIVEDGQWITLRELSDKAFGTEASVSARLRDLRKQKFGNRIIERRRRERGLFEYRMVRRPNEQA